MTLYADVDAIWQRGDLTDAEKRAQAATVKAAGLRDAVLAFAALPQTWNFSKSGVAWSVTLSRVAIVRLAGGTAFVDATGDCLALWASATKNGVAVRWGSPPMPCVDAVGVAIVPGPQFVWRNPPVLIGGGGAVSRNGRLCTYDPVTLVRSLLGTDVVGEAK